ncbi:lysosomal-associated transmembrane protein 4B-like [Schistocerca serialis cubense]|uniref:lysosomal-associated transmembrane protein 4B-like n=1 Tax=Schistocerca serialis cubense TaxID=2023355 RepID=UPI00214F24A9|nr:lysosomal-associated transmembrane protein 4B-like [Schistocerca serialis cubense]
MTVRTQANTMMLADCCCGCSLRTGTILIALWYLAASLVQLATMAYRLHTGDYMGGANDQTLQRMFSSDSNSLLPHPYLDTVEIMYTYSLLITSIVLNVIEALACAMLLYDGIKETIRFALLWVIIKAIITCLSSLVMVQMSTAFLSDDEFYLPGIIGLLICGIFMAISAYFILVVYSFYRSLRQKLAPKVQIVKKGNTVNKQKSNGATMNGAANARPPIQEGEKKYANVSEA